MIVVVSPWHSVVSPKVNPSEHCADPNEGKSKVESKVNRNNGSLLFIVVLLISPNIIGLSLKYSVNYQRWLMNYNLGE